MKVSGDWDKDFFKENPEFNLITIFKNFKESENDASQIMWGIYLLEDTRSPLSKIKDKEKRREEIDKNYHKIDWDKYQNLVEAYIDITLTDSQKSYKVWREKAQQLDNYVKTLDFKTDSEILVKLFKDAKNIWATLDEIQKRVSEESEDTTIKGQGKLSARDQRFI